MSLGVSGDDRGVAVLLVDVDDFKLVNDTRGHAEGDTVLRAVAGVLAGEVRGGDLVARLGGDDFGVLLPGAGASAASLVADRMVEVSGALQDGTVTVSIGVASGSTSGVLGTWHAAPRCSVSRNPPRAPSEPRDLQSQARRCALYNMPTVQTSHLKAQHPDVAFGLSASRF